MAPEPSHLVNITKTCPRCNSIGAKFMYLNNNKITQPRYKCTGEEGCGDLFTYGGKIRQFRVERPRPQQTSTTSTAAVVAADRPTAPPARRRGRPPRRSQRVTPQSGAREIQETPATSARTEARIVATRAATAARNVAARIMARPTTGALGLPRIPISQQRESPVVSPVVSSVENPAVRGPVLTARIAGLVLGDVVDVDQRTASRTAATVNAQGGDVMENYTKAVLGVSPYGLAPASNGKRMKVMRIKQGGKESIVQFWA